MAEDEGFEPSRLSSTRVRDARTRPLCESSKNEFNYLFLAGTTSGADVITDDVVTESIRCGRKNLSTVSPRHSI